MNSQKNKTWIAGVLLAVSASLCCITPVLALLSGVGGIAATFSWLEPARPYLISFTLLVLGFAWYQKLKPRKQEEIDCACEDETRPSFWQSKNFLGMVTILAIGLLTFPSYSHIFYSNNNEKHAVITNKSSFITADFSIDGMTCSGCEEHVRQAVIGLEGIIETSISYKEGKAVIRYDASKTSLEKIKEVINATGYKVIDSKSIVDTKDL